VTPIRTNATVNLEKFSERLRRQGASGGLRRGPATERRIALPPAVGVVGRQSVRCPLEHRRQYRHRLDRYTTGLNVCGRGMLWSSLNDLLVLRPLLNLGEVAMVGISRSSVWSIRVG
jgi:hypothetical protein